MTTVEVKTAGVTSGSTMVALYPDPGDIRAAIKGDLPEGHEDPSTWHFTLAYLGDYTDPKDTPFDPEAVHAAVEGWAASRGPLSGELAGVGRFVGSEEQGDPVWVHADVAGLPDFRQALVQMLVSAGIPVKDNHGFTAHCTLAYVPKGAPMTVEPADSPVPVRFTHVSVASGDVARHYRLSGVDVAKVESKVLEPVDPDKAVRDAHRAAHQKRLDDYEQQMADGIEELWDRQKATVLARLRGPRSRKMAAKGIKADPNYSLNSVKWTAEAIQFAIKMLAQIFGLSWVDTARRLGHPDMPEPDPLQVDADISPYARRVVEALVAKQGKVVEAIQAAQAEGKTLEETAEIVEGVYADSDRPALQIAKSVSTGLANRAGLSVAREVGVMYKQWLASHDLRVRETHRVADGQEVRLDAKFSVGDALLDHPGDVEAIPDHPGETINCRCTLLYAFGDQPTGYSGHDWSETLPVIPKKVPPTPRTVKAFGVLLDRLEGKSVGLAWIDEPRDPHTGQWVRGGSVLSEIFEAPKWKPVMSRDEAEVWAKDSAIQQVGTFVGRGPSVEKIRREGFSLAKTSAGRVWGDGVYMGTAGLRAKDHDAVGSPEWMAWEADFRAAMDDFTEGTFDSSEVFRQQWLDAHPEPTAPSTLSDPSVDLYARMKDTGYDDNSYNMAYDAWEERYQDWAAEQPDGAPSSRGAFERIDPEPVEDDFAIGKPKTLLLKVNVRNPAIVDVGRSGDEDGGASTAMIHQIPGFATAYQHARAGSPGYDGRGTAISDALRELGYDALIVRQGDPNDPGIDSGTGGPQVVVFDPKNVTVIDEPYRYTDLKHKSLLILAADFQAKVFNPDQPRIPKGVQGAGEWVRSVGLGSLRVRDYEGRRGEAGHITRNEWGTVPTSVLATMPGVRGEVPGEHRNKKGAKWKAFVEDIRTNGVKSPLFITVNPGEQPKISEGSHRRDAALEAGLPTVPVEIRYFGHAEQDTPVEVVPSHPHDALAEAFRPGADWGNLRGHYNPLLPTPEREEFRRDIRAMKGLTKQRMEQQGDWDFKTLAQVERAAKQRLARAQIRVRIPTKALDQIIADGRLKNQHETETSMGSLNPRYRRLAEQVMFGYPSFPEPEDNGSMEAVPSMITPRRNMRFAQADIAPGLRPLPGEQEHPSSALPIYGFLVDPSEPGAEDVAEGYGNTVLVLKNSLRHRTTFTGVDSLGGNLYPSPIDQPRVESLTTEQMLGLAGGAAFGKDFPDGKPNWPLDKPYTYVEAQIHGGVTLDDIAEIHLHGPAHEVAQAIADGTLPKHIRVVTRAYGLPMSSGEVLQPGEGGKA